MPSNGLGFEDIAESFAYDSLNRVTASTTSGLFSRILDYQYDDLGNLTYRSDTGTLTYNRTSNAGVHAITSSTLDDFATINGGIDQLLGLTGMYLTYTAKQGQLAIIRENKWNGFNYQNGLRSGMRIINGASKGVFALGTSISLYQGMSAYRSGDGFGVAKSGVDITFSIGALVAGKVGMVGGITYYGTSTLLQYSPTATYYLVDKPVDFACKISGC